jgi:predicted HicB family RNase H-like nuclease
MMSDVSVDVTHYTYRVSWSTEDGEYVGTCVEFPSLSWLASSQSEALIGIEQLVTEVAEDLERSGEVLPIPLAERGYSGKFQVRMSSQLHRRLAQRAAEQNMSLNRFVEENLAASV